MRFALFEDPDQPLQRGVFAHRLVLGRWLPCLFPGDRGIVVTDENICLCRLGSSLILIRCDRLRSFG